MRSTPPILPLALAVLVALVLAVPAAAQEEKPGTFGEVIDVRVVNLEAVVTDKDGVHVHGLGPDDFLLEVDGRAVPIEYFTEVTGGTAVARGDEAGMSTLPALAPGEPVGTSYLVFVDEYFALAVDRDRVLRHLREQLPLLAPEDRMAIVAFDGRRLEMLSSWSNDVEELDRILRGAVLRPAHGLQRAAELRSYASNRALRGIPTTANVGIVRAGVLDVDEEQQVEILADQVRRGVLAATAALRSFARPPGRKVMLLLSGGWPYNPATWVVSDPARAAYVDPDDYGEALYAPLVETANRLSYTLYPVDVPAFDSAGVDASAATVAESAVAGRQLFEQEQDEHATLGILAEETGGRALLNAAASEVLTRVVEDTRTYYWLGFTPAWQGDDSGHRVRLRARDPKLRVRTRESYSDLSRQTEVSMMVESALLFGNAPSAQPLYVELGAPERAGLGKMDVPMRLALPLHALTFLPTAEGLQADVELRVAVLDDEGNTADVPVVPFTLRVPEPVTHDTYYPYATSLKLRRRHHDLVVSLYDVASGTILSSKLEVSPGD